MTKQSKFKKKNARVLSLHLKKPQNENHNNSMMFGIGSSLPTEQLGSVGSDLISKNYHRL